MQKTLSFLRVSLKNCGASNWEPKNCLKLGHFQKTSYFAMRFKGTPKISFFPKPWSSEFETDGAVELFFNSEPEICHFKTHFPSKFRAPWFFAGQNSNKRHFAHRWCKTPGEKALQGLSSGGIFRLRESFQDLSLEDVFLKLNLNWSVFLQLGVRIAWNCGAFHWEFRSGKKLWSSELKMHSLWVVQRSEFWAPWFSTANFVRAVWNSGAQNSTPMVQWSFFLIEPPEAKTMGAIAQNESPEAKTTGAIVQKGQNHGSYRSKRSPRGHLDEAPVEMGLR